VVVGRLVGAELGKVAVTVHRHGAGGAAMEEARGSAKKENGEGCKKKKTLEGMRCAGLEAGEASGMSGESRVEGSRSSCTRHSRGLSRGSGVRIRRKRNS
jgi:hypothetical protein